LIETYKQEGKEEIYQEADEILREVEKFYEIAVEKPVKELKRLWEENEEEVKAKRSFDEAFSFFSSLPLPEVSLPLLERISNKFLKEFDWKKFEGRGNLGSVLGLFLSAFLSKNIENYVLSQENKGIKEENIKPIEVHLKVKEAPIVFNCLGYLNPKKLHLAIEGDCGSWTGGRMQGGKIVAKGNCECSTGERMRGGKIIVERNCERWTGEEMLGGELIIKREVESFAGSAFVSPGYAHGNQGTIIWKGIKIWEKGDWTKEGKEMKEKGKIPM